MKNQSNKDIVTKVRKVCDSIINDIQIFKKRNNISNIDSNIRKLRKNINKIKFLIKKYNKREFSSNIFVNNLIDYLNDKLTFFNRILNTNIEDLEIFLNKRLATLHKEDVENRYDDI